MAIVLFFLYFLLATDWKDYVVSSGSFDNPSGHQNPNSMPVNSYTKEADFVRVGAFALSKGIYLFNFANSWQGHRNSVSQLLWARPNPTIPRPDHNTGNSVPYIKP